MQTNWLWGYMIPIGLLLLAWGGLEPAKARRVTPLAALALALTIIGYWLLGYGLHLGGAYVVNPDPGLEGLGLLYGRDVNFGLFGMSGFGLTWKAGEIVSPAALGLFLSYLPIMASTVLLVTLALAELRRWLMVVAAAFMGALVAPVVACWIWGGGWLSQLGRTMDLGHGFVDYGGSALLLWLPASFVFGVLLLQPKHRVAENLTLPPVYYPLLANLGALFIGLGWMGWTLSEPFHVLGATYDWTRAAINVLLGMAGATLTSQFYAWLSTGDIEPLFAARGLTAGWGAILAGAAFLPPWAALVVGLIAGLLFPFMLFVTEVTLRLKDRAATIALGLTGGLWGVVSVAIFADARSGMGWNGVDLQRGVAGLLARGESQLIAQLLGLLAIGAWGLLWGLLLGGISRLGMPRRSHTTEATDPTGYAELLEFEAAGDDALAEALQESAPPEPVDSGAESQSTTDEAALQIRAREDVTSDEA